MRKSKYSDEIINYIKESPKGHIELEIVENSSIYLFLKHIYKNSIVHLDRKKEIADLFISKFEENVQDRIKYKNAIQDFINCPLYK